MFLADKWNGTPDYGEIESVLRGILGERIAFGDLVQEAMEQGSLGNGFQWIKMMVNLAVRQLQGHGQTIGYLMILILSAAFLAVWPQAFGVKISPQFGYTVF